MRFMGFKDGKRTQIGRVVGDQLAPIAEAMEFYEDLPGSLKKAKEAEGSLAISSLEERPAVTPAARVLCVGLNYKAHAAEGGNEVPDYPAIFGRWTRSLVANGTDVPCIDERMDWECELAVIIGKQAINVSEGNALDHVFGYACFNDISARAYQRHTHQWTPGKNGDRSGPISQVVTADEIGKPMDGWGIQTRVNGQVMQKDSTDNMVFTVPHIISYLSSIMTLYPGDVIATGTPEGVGHHRKPPIFLKPGDTVEIEIDNIGILKNKITTADQRP